MIKWESKERRNEPEKGDSFCMPNPQDNSWHKKRVKK